MVEACFLRMGILDIWSFGYVHTIDKIGAIILFYLFIKKKNEILNVRWKLYNNNNNHNNHNNNSSSNDDDDNNNYVFFFFL